MIIGFTGPARVGKTTAANLAAALIPGATVVSFGDPIKRMLAEGLGLTAAQLHGDRKHCIDVRYGKSPRELMQTLGTGWGRNMVGRSIWVNALDAMLETVDGPVLIDDVRFEGEAQYVRERGVLVHVSGRTQFSGDHESERGVTDATGDHLVDNRSTLAELNGVIVGIVRGLDL